MLFVLCDCKIIKVLVRQNKTFEDNLGFRKLQINADKSIMNVCTVIQNNELVIEVFLVIDYLAVSM